jgi:hypothetical protein
VTERSQAFVSRHGAAPRANCAEPNAGVQDRLVARSPVATNQPSKITVKGSSLSTMANGNRYWPTASVDTSTFTPGAQVDRLAPFQAPPGHARSSGTLAWRLA